VPLPNQGEINVQKLLKPLEPGAVAVGWGVQGATRLVLSTDGLTLTIYYDRNNLIRYKLPMPEGGISAMSASGPAIVDLHGVLWVWPWSPGSSPKARGKVSWKRAAALEDGRLIDASTSEPVQTAS
jgi:hypothetical protein